MSKNKKILMTGLSCLLIFTVLSVGMVVVKTKTVQQPFAPFPEQAPNLVLQATVTQNNGTQEMQFDVEQTIDNERPFYEYKMDTLTGEPIQYQAILGQQFIFGIGTLQKKQKVTPEQLAAMMMNHDAQVVNDTFFAEEEPELAEQVYDQVEYVGKELHLGRVVYRFHCGYEKDQQISRTKFTKEFWLDEQTGVTLKSIETTEFELEDATNPLTTVFEKTFEVNQLTINEIAS